MLNKSFLLLIVLIVTGCSSIGPAQINTDRGTYNEIVRQTDYEQLLTNIVHLSYVEPTSYLQVTNVTASYNLSKGTTVSPSWSQEVGGGAPLTTTSGISIAPTISYSDSPTISYVPLNDAEFISTLQTAITFTDVALLFNGGYDNTEFLGRLIFDKVGVLDNASSASSPRVINTPEYQQFYSFLDTLAQMRRARTVDIQPVTFENRTGLMIAFISNSVNSPQALKLKKLVQIPLDSKSIILMSQQVSTLKMNPTTGQLVQINNTAAIKNLVYVKMRSIYGVMTFLSHSVQIPEKDIQGHLTLQLMDTHGQPYNWAPLMSGLMTIYSSNNEPQDAFVKTWTNGHWFYIKSTDINSKSTFDILVRLMTLTAGMGTTGAQTAPVLTVPV